MLSFFPQSLKDYEHLHFSDFVDEISHRHVENVILLGKTNTAIVYGHNNPHYHVENNNISEF